MLLMTIKIWLDNAVRDAERRGLPALGPMLEALTRATLTLRTADWNPDASGPRNPTGIPDAH
jgi:hypothetical protein